MSTDKKGQSLRFRIVVAAAVLAIAACNASDEPPASATADTDYVNAKIYTWPGLLYDFSHD